MSRTLALIACATAVLCCLTIAVSSDDLGTKPESRTVNFTVTGSGCGGPSGQDIRSYYADASNNWVTLIPSVESDGFIITDVVCDGASCQLAINEDSNTIWAFDNPGSQHFTSGLPMPAGAELRAYANRITVSGYVLPTSCQSDINGSGEVDVSDLLQVLADWGLCGGE